MNFLLANFFSSNLFLVIILLVAMVLLIFTSVSRRKKEETYRNELDSKIVAGAKVKTYGGIYGTVVSIKNTTDGKIVLIETGEDDKKSYQQLHINAIYGIDDSEEMVVNADGEEVPLSELNKPAEETEEAVEKEEPKKKEKKAVKETADDVKEVEETSNEEENK